MLAGRSLRFCVHIFWQVWDIQDDCWTSSAVLCIVFLLFKTGEKEQKKKKQKHKREK
jgi:hypothetical protein